MDVNGRRGSSYDQSEAEEEAAMELRRGPWTVEEDLTLINYIANHGEGRWNSLARCAGLKRTGKSCRLRWLNYLRPDVRRGNITLEEQLLILELHSRWGNRWSKIAQYLPGRTDNEIKNYWRTRVQKHAKQLKCDVNSKQFKDTMKYLWMPRLVERIQATSTNPAAVPAAASMAVASPEGSTITTNTTTTGGGNHHSFDNNMDSIGAGYGGTMEINSGTTASSSDSFDAQVSNLSDYYAIPAIDNSNIGYFPTTQSGSYQDHEPVTGYYGNTDYGTVDYQAMDQNQSYQWMDNGDTSGNLWNVEDINWYLNHNI